MEGAGRSGGSAPNYGKNTNMSFMLEPPFKHPTVGDPSQNDDANAYHRWAAKRWCRFEKSTIVVSALPARANFGKLLRPSMTSAGRWSSRKRGTPKAVLISIRDYGKLAAPEVLRVLGEEAERNRTSSPTSRQIDKIIKASRSQKPKR
jgi:hypothetical protein